MKENYRAKEEKEVLNSVKRRKASWICHVLRTNCILKHVTEEVIEGMGRRGRRRKEGLDYLKEKRRKS